MSARRNNPIVRAKREQQHLRRMQKHEAKRNGRNDRDNRRGAAKGNNSQNS